MKNKNISGPEIARRRKLARPPMTQLDLSRKVQAMGVGLDRAAIAKIERGLRGVMDFELVAIARALRVPPEKVLSGGGKR